MKFLARLTDLALHRLYAYVLKKLLGPFLENELILDQLEVSLLAGRIELSCLQLNSSLLTSYASALGLGAVEVSSASVTRLSVFIPYSKLLTEEIVFTFEGANLDLVTSTSSFPLSPAAKLNASALSGSIINEYALKGEYAKDMDFVVTWIEQIISTVRVEVKDATINMKSGKSGGGNSMLCVHLHSFTYCDETMEHAYNSPSFAYKRVSVAPLSVSLTTDRGSVVDICRTEELCSARLRLCKGVTPLMEVDIGLCQVNFKVDPEVLSTLMVLVSACRRNKHQDSISSYDDPMRWAYLFGDPFWSSAASFMEFAREETESTEHEHDIDIVAMDKILQMYAVARAKLEDEAATAERSMCESTVYFDAKDHDASDSEHVPLVPKTELRLDGKLEGFKVDVASSQTDCPMSFVISGTHASASWLQRFQDKKPSVMFKMASLSLKEKRGESFATLLDAVSSNDLDSRDHVSASTTTAGAVADGGGPFFSPFVQLTFFTENTSELLFKPIFISVNVPAYLKFVSIISTGFKSLATTEPNPCGGGTVVEYDHNSDVDEDVEVLAPAFTTATSLLEPSSSPKSACWYHHLNMKCTHVLLEYPHCSSYNEDDDGLLNRSSSNEMYEYLHAELQDVTSVIYIGGHDRLTSSHCPSPLLTVHCDTMSSSVTVDGHKMKFIHLEGTPSGLATVSKSKPCEFMVSHFRPEISELEGAEAVSGTGTSTFQTWNPGDERISHCAPSGNSTAKSNGRSLIQCSFNAASAAVGISVRGIAIIKRLFAANTHNAYSSEYTTAEMTAPKNGIPITFSVDNVSFVVADDSPEDPDLFAGKAYCATTLSGITGIFSKRGGSLQLSAADVTFMEGDNLQRKRTCSLLQDAVDLAKQCLEECTLAPVLLYRTPYVRLEKGSNVLDVKLECGGTERGSTLNINLTCITMRHTLPLYWPTRLKSLIAALSNQLNDGASSLPKAHSSVATTVFATIHNGIVDYVGDGMRDLGHALVSVGQLRLSATVVAHAPTHVAKIIARDAAMYVTNSSRSSSHLGGGENPNYRLQHHNQVEVSSLQDALENWSFVQIATLDFADVVVTASRANAIVELWMGTLRAYTCSDSLASILGLLSHWWLCLQDQIQKQVLAKAKKSESNKPTVLGNTASRSAEPHILQGIDSHIFSPRNVSKHIHDMQQRKSSMMMTETNTPTTLDDKNGQEHSTNMCLPSAAALIEEFYCLNEVAQEVSALGQREGEEDGCVKGGKEILEQPQARWISRSTESSCFGENDSAFSMSSNTSGELSIIGSVFNLPCDIDIELEEREEGGGRLLVPQEEGEREPLPSISPPHLSSSPVDSEDDGVSVNDEIYPLSEEQWSSPPPHPSPSLHPVAQWFTSSSNMRIYPHHMPIPQSQKGQPSVESLGDGDGVALAIVLHDLNICFRMFKGCDWPAAARNSTDSVNRPVLEPEYPKSKDDDISSDGNTTEKERVSQAELLDALIDNYKEVPPPPPEGNSRTNYEETKGVEAKSGRVTMSMIQVLLNNVSMRLDSYQQLEESSTCGETLLSHLAIAIRDVHVSDTLGSHRLRKTLGHWCDDSEHPRELHDKILTMQITTRTPSQRFLQCGKQLGDELRVKIRLLPLHLSFSQHTIDFLREFFTASLETEDNMEMGGGDETPVDPACISFFQSFDIGACKLLVDYIPRNIRIDALKSGSYLELLNLFPLEGVSLSLNRVLLSGASGVSVALSEALKSWVQDVTSSQMHQFLAGASVIRPFVHVGQGMLDLVLIPLQQYRKDKKILRGLKGGAASFCRIVLDEALNTSHRLTGAVARTLDGIVPGRPVDKYRPLPLCQVNQPKGVCDGFEYAFETLQGTAKGVTVGIPYEEHERDAGGYIRTIIRVLPIAVLRPVVGATEALSLILLGFRNSANPQRRRDEEAMWSWPEY